MTSFCVATYYVTIGTFDVTSTYNAKHLYVVPLIQGLRVCSNTVDFITLVLRPMTAIFKRDEAINQGYCIPCMHNTNKV